MATYDFIVVGAGSAGCAVAGRLAAQSSARVLLLEAGGSERRFLVRAPLAFGRQLGTSLDWGYESESEPACAGRRIPLPRGRVLGGTSAMNAMVWVRGSDLDYDGWDLDGWAWRDVKPVFDRIERDTMRITRVQSPDELSTRFVAAARAAGVAATDDVSGPTLDGAAISPVTIDRGQRWSSARGYLRPRKNLTVETRALLRRVIIRNNRAVGVEYRHNGRVKQALVEREIVLSAGAFGTPQLLQLSGVGPVEHLRSVGIAPLVDSPRVGQGLTDHPNAFAVWALRPGFVGLSDAANPKWLAQWLIQHKGKFTSNVIEAVAHIRSATDLPACDVQLGVAPVDMLADPRKGKLRPALSFILSHWTPKSRGDVLIRSSDPTVAPAIRLNLLAERDDVDALVRAVTRVREIVATEPLASAVADEMLPGVGADVEASVRDTAITTSHAACSVAMGSAPDSALDERLRVRGVDGLRVADASALPVIPRANTNAPAIMLGERCADFLLA